MAYGIIEDGVGVRTGPPTGAITAAKGNATAAKVSILMARGEARNYAIGGPAATATANVPIVAGTQGLAGTLSSSAYFNFPASVRTNGPEYSVLTVIRPSGGGVFFDCGNFRIQLQNVFTDTSIQVDKAGAVQLIDARLGAGTIGTWLAFAVTYNATTGALTVSASNGVRASTTSAQTLTDGASVLGNCSTVSNDVAMFAFAPTVWNAQQVSSLLGNPWQLFEADNDPVFYSLSGAADYPVTATDALTLADSASQAFAATAVASDAVTLSDIVSNVAALGATGSAALTLADSASNVAALTATATDALTLADTLNASAAGDYTASSSDGLTLADSASNVAALSASASDALTLADSATNVASLGATASDALTLADTVNASTTGEYVAVASDALSLGDTLVAAYAAICIATDAMTLADATSAAMAGEYAATATDALTLADAAANAAALGVSISEALTLAALVSALLTGNTALTGTRGGYGVQMQLAARRAQIQTGRRRN